MQTFGRKGAEVRAVHALASGSPTMESARDSHCAQMAGAALVLARTGAASVAAIVARYADQIIAIRADQMGAQS